MPSDEQQIRELVATWHSASKAGDVDAVLGLMTDDVIFLRPGCSPMNKSGFADAMRVSPGSAPPKIEGSSEIQEIQVAGEWAFMWSRILVRVTPPGADEATELAGYTLSVFRKVGEKWLLARDANLLAPVAQSN